MFSKKRSAISGILLVLPYTAGFLLFYGYPFVLVLRQSLRRGAGKNAQFVGLEIIADTLRSSGFRLALGNTIKFLAVVLPAIIVLSFAIALTLRAQMSSRDVLRSVVLLPYLMPVVGAAGGFLPGTGRHAQPPCSSLRRDSAESAGFTCCILGGGAAVFVEEHGLQRDPAAGRAEHDPTALL